MAITLQSPQYSFLQFDKVIEPPCCNGDTAFALPIALDNDLAFQFRIECSTAQESVDVLAKDITTVSLYLLRGTGNTTETLVDNTVRNYTALDHTYFQAYRTGTREITYSWKNGLPSIATYIPIGKCFQIAIVAVYTSGGVDTVIESFSNPLLVITPDCYTTVLEYFNDEDSYDFRYCNIVNPVNRVRLPFYLSQPQLIDTKTVYRTSTGKRIVTAAVTDKEYSVITNALSEELHDKFELALNHDAVNVEGSRYSGGIYMDGGYNQNWDDPKDCTAPADFKVFITPFYAVNDNCQDCKEIDVVNCEIVQSPHFTVTESGNPDPLLAQQISIAFTPALVDVASLSVAYRAHGTSDAYVSVTKPAVSPIVILTPAGVQDIVITSLGVDCINDSTGVFVSDTDVCTPIAIVGAPSMPDGHVDTPYDYSFDITGDAPFEFSTGPTDQIQPDWMAVNVNNITKKVTFSKSFSGTQTAGSFDIKATITNCSGANSIIFTDTFIMS